MNINTKNIFGPKDVKKAMKLDGIGKRVIVEDSYYALVEAIFDYYDNFQNPAYSGLRLLRIVPEDGHPYIATSNTEDFFEDDSDIVCSKWIYVIPEYADARGFDLSRVYTARDSYCLRIGDRCIFADSIDELTLAYEDYSNTHRFKECDLIKYIEPSSLYPFNGHRMAYLVERICDRQFLDEVAAHNPKVTITINGKEVTFNSIEEARAILGK